MSHITSHVVVFFPLSIFVMGLSTCLVKYLSGCYSAYKPLLDLSHVRTCHYIELHGVRFCRPLWCLTL